MSLRRLVLALATVVSLGLAATETFVGRVVSIDDGDTVRIIKDGYASKVRLEGIDCPERGQPFGQRARQRTADLLLGKSAEATVVTVDLYGRLVARLRVGGVDVSETLVREGLAWHFTKYSSDKSLAASEVLARKGRLGLWSESNAVPPWEWRHPLKASSPPAPLVRQAPGANGVGPQKGEDTQGPLHGNQKSRVYHTAACKNYLCSNCTRIFQSEEEARLAGYRPAGCCHR